MHFFVTCHFHKFVVFSAVKVAAYEELITHIYTLFAQFNLLGLHNFVWANKNSLCLEFFNKRLDKQLYLAIYMYTSAGSDGIWEV